MAQVVHSVLAEVSLVLLTWLDSETNVCNQAVATGAGSTTRMGHSMAQLVPAVLDHRSDRLLAAQAVQVAQVSAHVVSLLYHHS